MKHKICHKFDDEMIDLRLSKKEIVDVKWQDKNEVNITKHLKQPATSSSGQQPTYEFLYWSQSFSS